jgi:hypothetical protein
MLPGVRAWIAAVVVGVAGFTASLVVYSRRTDPAAPPPGDAALTRDIAALRERLDRLERSLAARSRVAAEPSASGPVAESEGAPERSGRRGREGAPAAAETPVDLSKVSSADLALEADDRHAHDFDISGAAKRYRELLSRASTPSDRRHWNIRLGDCYVRLHHQEEAVEAYRACIDASTEDHIERVACMNFLACRESGSNPAEGMRWIDRALELESGRENRATHETAAGLARELRQADREVREIQWLLDHGGSPDADANWRERLAELRGEKR